MLLHPHLQPKECMCVISKQTVENILPSIIKRTILFIPAFKETHNTQLVERVIF